MTTELRITRARGGNHHPLSTRQFILDYLIVNGEATVSDVHKAYKIELRSLAARNHSRHQFHCACYASFKTQMLRLVGEGSIKLSGREEPASSKKFERWAQAPILRYYCLTAGAPTLVGRENGRKLALGTGDGQGRVSDSWDLLPRPGIPLDNQRSTNGKPQGKQPRRRAPRSTQ